MSKPGLTEKIAVFATSCGDASFSDELYEHAKLAMLDWLAVAIAGRDEALVRILRRQAASFGGAEQATIIGHGEKTNVSLAALVNGSMSHALDYDDNLSRFLGHPTVSLAPAIFAVAEARKLSGKAALRAYLTGLSTGVWFASVTGTGHYMKGFHGTATVGRQAATAAVANLIGLSAEQATYALGISGTLTNGLKQSFGTMCKPLHAGEAARGAVEAATLAAEGFLSARDIYEGPLGFMETHHGAFNDIPEPDLSAGHPVERLEHKMHAACYCTHGAINVAMDLVESDGLESDAIDQIEVGCAQVSIDNAGKTKLDNGLDGKFSIAYTVANAIVNGTSGPEAFTDEAVKNPQVLDLMSRIKVEAVDIPMEQVLKVSVSAHLKDGRVLEGVNDPIGNLPPLNEKRGLLTNKFLGLCEPILGLDKAERLKAAVDELDRGGTADGLMALTVA